MAEKKVIDLQINTNIDKTTTDLNKLEHSLSKVTKESDKTKKSVDDVASNGGAIAILDQLTGGLATSFKDAYEATKLFNFSLKGMKSALIATGIGALVVALGTIVAYWDEINEFITGANKRLEEQKKLLEEKKGLVDSELTLNKSQLKLAGETTTEGLKLIQIQKHLLKEKQKLLEAEIKTLEATLLREKAEIREVTLWEKIKVAALTSAGLYKQAGEASANAVIGSSEDQTRLNELQNNLLKLKTDLVETNFEFQNLGKPKTKEGKVVDTKKEEDLESARLEKINAIREKYRLQSEDAEDVTEFEKLERRYQRDLLELERLGASEQQKLDLELYYNGLRTQQQVESIDYLAQLEIESENERLLNLEKISKAKMEIVRLEAEFRKSQAIEVVNVLGNLQNIVGKQTAIGKAIGIATATINTFQGASEALKQKSTLPSPFDVIAKVANVATVIGVGLKTVKSIASVQLPASAGGGGSSSTPSISVPQAQSPSFNIVGQGGANQLAQSIGGQNQQPIRTYVVSSDVSTSQALDRNIVRSASLG